MKLLTIGDIIDTYIHIKQKGINSVLYRVKLNKIKRIVNNWNENKTITGFWHIPLIMEHWNKIITDDSNVNYVEYICKKYLSQNKEYSLLSVGSGTGFYEREFANQRLQTNGWFSKIIGIELSESRVKEARRLATENNLNIKYINQNFYNINFNNEKFDIILFNSSLHHFENIEIFLSKYIKPLLNQNGFLVICEYVGCNRVHIPNFQLKEVNKTLQILPEKYRKYANVSNYKNKVYSPGYIRMKLNDPSEAVDSESILPSIHKHFSVLEEKSLGCNLLMPLMRGIAYNFINDNIETQQILQSLIETDINFTKENIISDFVFGVYK